MEDDIENQWSEREIDIEKPKAPPRRLFGLSVFNVVGSIANIIRTIICISMAISVVIVFCIAVGILANFFTSAKILYAIAAVGLVGTVTIAFDCSTSQWLIQKVLKELSHDIVVFEENLKIFKIDLDLSKTQIKERDRQLKESQDQISKRDNQLKETNIQIKKQEVIITNFTVIQANLKSLVTSLMDAQQDGINLNDLFRSNITKFEQQIARIELFASHMENSTFQEIDLDHNNIIDTKEFQIYVSRKK